VKCWDPETLTAVYECKGHNLGVVSVVSDPSGSRVLHHAYLSLIIIGVASSSLDSHIRLWNVADGSLARDIDCGPGEVWSVAFSPDARFVASGSQSGNVNVWETETGTKQMVLEDKGKFVLSVAYVSTVLEDPISPVIE